jgi:photosystem II stability/assembly factor-like uncharacterized protein
MRPILLLPLFCLTFSSATFADDKVGESKEPKTAFDSAQFRLLGPNVGGRVSMIAGVPGDASTAYFGAAQGGVWKTTDGGLSWKPIFDEQMTGSIGSLVLAPSDPSVIYVGSGEANIRGNAQIGHGIFKSVDAGKTWQHVWKQIGQIGQMAVHPSNPDVAFAAVLGSPFGSNPQRGVFRTRDGGKTWQQVLKVNADTGASDVSFDPNRPNVLYAGMWQTRRTPWSFTSGGDGSGLYVSHDGGDTWDEISTDAGLPKKPYGKIGVRVSPVDSNRVFALIEAKQGGLFRSDDGGESFTRVSDHHSLRQRAWYYSGMTPDPQNADVVWFPQVPMLKTLDGGEHVISVSGFYHGDHHSLWIDPQNPKRILDANDGGVELSYDGGKTWRNPKLPLAQFYNIDVDNRMPFHVGGTMQDMGTSAGPSATRMQGGIGVDQWYVAGGGEAGDFVFDRGLEGVIYAGEYGGYISQYVEGTGQYRSIMSWPGNPSGWGSKWSKHRFQWTAPIAASPHDAKVLYHGGEVLFKTTDGGANWTIISPDLTRNDKAKQQRSGGPITGDNTGVEVYDTIFSIAESPVVAGEIWIGTDDGLLQLTRDGGKTWQNITPKNAWPQWATVEAIAPSLTTAGEAWVVVDAHRLDDHQPYVFKISNHGSKVVKQTTGLPADWTAISIAIDPRNSNWLVLGGTRGLFSSADAGAHWSAFKANLPPVAVTDLQFKNDALVLGTRGRALWVLDDVNPLREWSTNVAKSALHFFKPPTATRTRFDFSWGPTDATDNPKPGASLSYFLAKDVDAKKIRLDIFDATGKKIRTLKGIAKKAPYAANDADEPRKPSEADLNAKAGMHSVQWDLRQRGVPRLNAKLDAGDPETGPLVLPGTYTLKMTAGNAHAEQKVDVLADPKSGVSLADMQANHELALHVRGQLITARRAILRLKDRRARAQLDLAAALQAGDATAKQNAKARAAALLALEQRLHNPEAKVVYDVLAGRQGGAKWYSQAAPLLSWIDQSDHAPTTAMRNRSVELDAELANILRDCAENCR